MLPRSCIAAPLVLVLVACHHTDRQTQELPPAPIVIDHPKLVQEFESVSVSGLISSPGTSSMVAFMVPGRAVLVGPREGEPVRKGQLLAALDSVSLQLAVDAAHAQAEVANAAAQRAEDEYERMKQLFDSKSLAPNDFMKFKTVFETTRQQYRQALAAEGLAKKNLSDARLVAPISGFVARRMLEPGVMVGVGQPVFEIAALDPVEVSVGVPETDVHLVKVGQKATVKVAATAGKVFQGNVNVVNISTDPSTRTYMTRIRVPNPDHELKVGMVAEVSITGTQKRHITVVPAEAVVRDPQGATLVFQYFPEQKRVFSKRVDVGSVLGRNVEIKVGLKGDESIVVAGQNGLRNGMAANLTDATSVPTEQR